MLKWIIDDSLKYNDGQIHRVIVMYPGRIVRPWGWEDDLLHITNDKPTIGEDYV